MQISSSHGWPTAPASSEALFRLINGLNSNNPQSPSAAITCSPDLWHRVDVPLPRVFLDIEWAFKGRLIEGYSDDVMDFDTLDGPIKFLEENTSYRTAILDFTLPLGIRDTRVAEFLTPLPEKLSNGSLRSDLAASLAARLAATCSQLTDMICFFLPGVLSNSGGMKEFRTFMHKEMRPRLIVELPPGVLQPVTSVRLTAVAFRRGHTAKTLLYRIEDRSELDTVEEAPWFVDLLQAQQGHNSQHGILADLSRGEDWTFSRNSLGKDAPGRALLNIWESAELGDLFEIKLGARFERDSSAFKNKLPILRGRDIRPGIATKDLEKFASVNQPNVAHSILKGDLLIQRIGDTPKVIMADETLKGAIPGDTVILLRAKTENVPVESILLYLNSKAGAYALRASASGSSTVMTLSARGLASVNLPIPPVDITRRLRSAQEKENLLREQADGIAAVRQATLLVESSEDLERHLLDLETRVNAAFATMDAGKQFPHQIRNLYPYPLAFPYRLLAGFVNKRELYEEQLRVAEGLLAFVASLELSLCKAAGAQHRVNLKDLWKGGASAGKWQLAAELAGGALSDVKNDVLATALADLWRSGGKKNNFRGLTKDFVERRNAWHHKKAGRPETEEEFDDACPELQEKLDEALQALNFLIGFPIQLVCDSALDVRTGKSLLSTLKCMGDHPGFTQGKFESAVPRPRDVLFVERPGNDWVQLYPLIAAHPCPKCRTREIFFVDRVDVSAQGPSAILKSFEKNHEVESSGASRIPGIAEDIVARFVAPS